MMANTHDENVNENYGIHDSDNDDEDESIQKDDAGDDDSDVDDDDVHGLRRTLNPHILP